MELYLNGRAVDGVIGFSAERKTRRSRVDYNANGDMVVDQVVRKYTLEITIGLADEDELLWLYETTESIFFPVTFSSPREGIITRDFHLSSQPSEVLADTDSGIFYKTLKLVLEER